MWPRRLTIFCEFVFVFGHLPGTIETKRNAKNPRDLDIELAVKFNGRHSKCDTTQEYRLR